MASNVKEIDHEGNVYKGGILNGKRNGEGILLYADTEDVYKGDFEHGLPHGSGKYIRKGSLDGGADGIFEGLWNHGVLSAVKKGKAKIVLENGDVYEGGFNHWKRHGQGKLNQYNGAVYKGQWQAGLRNGRGKQSYPDGYVFEGQFKDDTPVKDGTQKEAHSVIMRSDSMELNPLVDEDRQVSKPFQGKSRKGLTSSRQRSRNDKKSPKPSFEGSREEINPYQRNNSRTSNRVLSKSGYNPPLSPSRRSHVQQMEEPSIKYAIPRSISFQSRSSGRGQGDEAIMFDDDTGLAGVESQVHCPPSDMHRKNSYGFFSKSQTRSQSKSRLKSNVENDPLEMKRLQLERLKEGNCLRKFAGNTLERQASRQRPRQQSRPRGREIDNNSTMKKGFGFFRSLSRNRSRSKSVNVQENSSTTQDNRMFVTSNDDEYLNGTPFLEEIPQFGSNGRIDTHLEEASGLTPPDFYHEKKSPIVKELPQIRSQSPHPRSSPRSKNMQGRNETTNYRSTSQSRNLNVPPRSHSGRHMQEGLGVQRSANRSIKSIERQQLSNRRGRERISGRESDWVSRSTSNGRSRDNRNSFDKSPQRLKTVQGMERNTQRRQSPYESRHQQDASRTKRSNSINRRQSQSRERGQDLESEYREFNDFAQRSYKESIQSRRSQYESVHQIKSVANKGNSGTLGMLALNMSSSDDSDYFVK